MGSNLFIFQELFFEQGFLIKLKLEEEQFSKLIRQHI